MSAAESIASMSDLYWFLGASVFLNFGTIITILIVGGKAVWFLSELNSRVKGNREMSVRAHKRIDRLESD